MQSDGASEPCWAHHVLDAELGAARAVAGPVREQVRGRQTILEDRRVRARVADLRGPAALSL